MTTVTFLASACGGKNPAAPAAPFAQQLAFLVQPRDAEDGYPLTPAVRVLIQDALGNTVGSATDIVTLSLGAHPAGADLYGITTAQAIAGIATFDDVRMDPPASGYTLIATSGNLVSATSAPFAIVRPLAAVSTGGESCGVSSHDIAYCWGSNAWGDLGDGTTAERHRPAAVSGNLTFAAVSTGFTHSCGVTTSMAAYCWGENTLGQLGDGTNTNRTSPVLVTGGLYFAAVSAGDYVSCGLTTGGDAYCWGDNTFGEVGDGTNLPRSNPTLVLGGLAFTGLSAGDVHACGVTSSGAAYCWGENVHGQLGDGTRSNRAGPVPVEGGLTFRAVSTGSRHSCGVTTSGMAYCWGANDSGELGTGATRTQDTIPQLVAGGLTFSVVSAGSDFTCGVVPNGAAYCWGYNLYTQLGDGSATNRSSPVLVAGGHTFAVVSAGAGHACGVTTGGAGYCWGVNTFGELGDGTVNSSAVPVQLVW